MPASAASARRRRSNNALASVRNVDLPSALGRQSGHGELLDQNMDRLCDVADGAVWRVAGIARVDSAVAPVHVAEPPVQGMSAGVVDANADRDLLVAQLQGQLFAMGDELRANASRAIIRMYLEMVQLGHAGQVHLDLRLMGWTTPQIHIAHRTLIEPGNYHHTLVAVLSRDAVSEILPLTEAADQVKQFISGS